MFNCVVFPQIQYKKDCNILNSLSNTAACISQAKKKSIKQPNIKSILHMTNKNDCLLMKEQLTAMNKKHGNSRDEKLQAEQAHVTYFPLSPYPIF